MIVFVGVIILFAAIVLGAALKHIETLQAQSELERKKLTEQLKDEPGVELGESEFAAIDAIRKAREAKR